MAPTLHDEAEIASGVSSARAEAAKHLRPSIFERHGEGFFAGLAKAFYSRVYEDAAFRVLFANTTREAAERNQREYLQQEFGDSRALYERRKGATALIGRHAPYPVFAGGAAVWLAHMEAALSEIEEEGLCDRHVRILLTDYFRFTAHYIVCGRELVNPRRTVGYDGRHEEGRT
jgi:truncated hemoglobin YjbI